MNTPPGSTANFYDQLSKFRDSRRLVSNKQELFYVFPDSRQVVSLLPATIAGAIDDGLLFINCLSGGEYSLEIANEHYKGSMFGLELILLDWALSEGYHWQ